VIDSAMQGHGQKRGEIKRTPTNEIRGEAGIWPPDSNRRSCSSAGIVRPPLTQVRKSETSQS
jgi:hypothetical protein